ncbi:hypothetical protein GCM10027348_15710 [Hymenobacter tenuis]
MNWVWKNMSDFYADSKQYNSGYQALFTGFYVVLGQRKTRGYEPGGGSWYNTIHV